MITNHPHVHIFAMAYHEGKINGFPMTQKQIYQHLKLEQWTREEMDVFADGYNAGVDDHKLNLLMGKREVGVQLMHLAAENGALTHACKQALELLQNPEAEDMDADRVIRLIEVVLSPIGV